MSARGAKQGEEFGLGQSVQIKPEIKKNQKMQQNFIL